MTAYETECSGSK